MSAATPGSWKLERGSPILSDVKVSAEEWTERHLTTWCVWKHGWYGPDGYPSEACVGENFSTWDWDGIRAYEKLDAWIAETADVVIDSLPPAQKASVYRAYGVVAAFRLPRGNYLATLAQAKAQVLLGLRRRGIWVGD